MITFSPEACASATLSLATLLKPAYTVYMEVHQGFEADVVGPAPLMTHHGRNKFADVAGS
jgi:hypothetical protein